MSLTQSQNRAIAARGNVLVVAGAGTGKTFTLVERCLALIEKGCSLENILMVTFTDAAAAEMRKRIRESLNEKAALAVGPAPWARLAEQLALLDSAPISTLHSFCLQLVREHFYELAIDPEVVVLDEQQTEPLIQEALDELFQRYYASETLMALAVQALIRQRGRGSDETIRNLIVKLHRHTQTLPDPAVWFDAQLELFSQAEPARWREWLSKGFDSWRARWLPALEKFAGATPNVGACVAALKRLPETPALAHAAAAFDEIQAADEQEWPRGSIGKVRDHLKGFFDEAEFFHSLTRSTNQHDPLAEDWEWTRHPMIVLLNLAKEFGADFARAKRDLGGIDFADLEQFTLQLLRDPVTGRPTPTALSWRDQFHYVFVDEYQDINAAQDSILTALSREAAEANRFLVGDVKQSIYRFRLANPKIFQRYEETWGAHPDAGQRILLTDNFRSREAILNFINPLFAALMRTEVGGVAYESDAQLRFGDRDGRQALAHECRGSTGRSDEPPVEFHLLSKSSEDAETGGSDDDPSPAKSDGFDLDTTEREARLIALRLSELKRSGHPIWDPQTKQFKPVTWRDMVVLLRSPQGRVESYAKEFHRAGVPLLAARGGFFQTSEISDLLSLLQLLDNPLQDVPLLAVLRSPLVGLSLDELAEIRAQRRPALFWTVIRQFQNATPTKQGSKPADSNAAGSAWRKVDLFLRRFDEWRELIRQTSLTHCLETSLTATHYEALLLAEPRGAERVANVRRLLDLARQYDPYQRQGLHRFLRFIAAQEEAELDHEPAPVQAEDAVRLLSIHKSKGLEFPVVVVAGLGGKFNVRDLNEDILLDEYYGLCPKITPPDADQSYPSLPYWLARQRERKELFGEALRLLYVAMTRARDTLILTGTLTNKRALEQWAGAGAARLNDEQVLSAKSFLDWLLLWLPQVTSDWTGEKEGTSALLRWNIYEADDARLLPKKEEPEQAPAAAPAGGEPEASVLENLRERVTWQYPFLDATAEPAKTSVSLLRRRWIDEAGDESVTLFAFGVDDGKAKTVTGIGQLTPAERGTAHHTFLQFVSLGRVGGVPELREEAERMSRINLLTAEEIAALDFAALARFWQSETGSKVLSQAPQVHRELPFTARMAPGELQTAADSIFRKETGGPSERRADGSGPNRAPLADEFIVVQGVVDLAVILPAEIWLLDFKTDGVTEWTFADKARLYEPQLHLYAEALGQIYGRPVTARWLHFLALGKTVSV